MREVTFEWRNSLCTTDFPCTAYEDLRQRVAGSTPFNTLAWMCAAERALPAGEQLQVLLGWRAGQLQLCLPLVIACERFGGLPFKIVHHLGFPLSDRIALLATLEPRPTRQALRQIRRRMPHALLQLNELPGSTEPETLLSQWARFSSTVEDRLSCRAPVHLISDTDRQEVSGDPRYKLRRARKRIAACGAQVRRLTPDATSMGPLLDAIREVEAVSWKGDEGVGIFADARRQQWMREAFIALAGEGRVRVVTLELEGRCISYRLGLFEQGRIYDYNLAFVPQYADLGSGRVLLEEWIHWGLDEGWSWIDASRVSLENSSHQLHERMTGLLEHRRWSFYSWRPSGLCLGLGLRLWQYLKPRLQALRAKRAAARARLAVTTDTPLEGRDAVPSHSQR
ncbi:GNAT family N-acetyltransferase [Pseudomonas sp. LS1212]|uniref:GNAT family N-acetyltransferase n=1 Tax=Pseudomonas sp. LS1212 TaxID=2972478 RepID=UPI00215C54DF|nr:GNAT family N-acetyltransferase [Pseudomonas sp. LS1212]UVJ41849.1 GNAT family N-acetyltransferase [Pseudomonas sp. LS1212]